MQAELKRAMTLTLNSLDKPYFVSYVIEEGRTWTGTATLGGLLNANASKFRRPTVQVRVGDYTFDNTNGGGGRGGASYSLSGFPLDDKAEVIRQYLWLETDSAYKGAVQSIAQKRAAQTSINVTDRLPDFAVAKPVVMMRDVKETAFDEKTWNERIKHVSAVLAQYPELRDSLVTYSAVDGVHRHVTSEGTQIRESQTEGSVQIRAAAQAKDGMSLHDYASFYSQEFGKMPTEADLTRAAKDVAEKLTKAVAAPVGEAYAGPVLFEGEASPQIMAELLGRNLHMTRPVAAGRGGFGGRGGPPGRGGPGGRGGQTEFEGRRGVRIMPDMFNVVDDPSLPMFGRADVDNEGVTPQRVSLVEKGVLKDFFSTRLPMQGMPNSNGHAMIGNSAGPTNLIITTTEKTPLGDMRRNLIDLVKQRNLPYGVIVRKLDFQTGGGTSVAPLAISRIYADGHEQQIRGVRLRGMNARSLKDILQAGDDSVTLDYLESGSAEVTVVAPSVLIDDLEIEKVTDTLPKLPVAAPPEK